MKLPEYTDDIGWNDIIYRYLHNDQELKARQDIEYHMWNYFKNCLKRSNRYFFENPILPLLELVISEHMLILAKNTTVFRARNDNEHSLYKEWNNYANTKHTPLLLEKFKCKNVDAEIIQKMECDYNTKINSSEYQKLKQRIENGFQGFDASGSTAPPSDKSSAGRCNPEGVSYLYAALEEHTAVAEIRPHIKDTISIATLKTMRDLKLIDLDYNTSDTVKGKDFLFNDIQTEFSLINKGNSKEYLITQYITALIEHLGYDGLCFRSSLVKDGTNYVIFNPNDCCVLSSKLYFLSEVSYTYNQCI